MVDWTIDDEKIFSELKLNSDSSFNEFIKSISAYAYDEIGLEHIFKIEEKLRNLLECELFLSITKKRHRDHLLHACRIARLGEMILKEKIVYNGITFTLLDISRELYKMNPNIIKEFESYELEINNENLLRIWYVGALFHDIGFIYEAFKETAKNIEFLWNIKEFKKLHLDVQSAINEFESNFGSGQQTSFKTINSFDHAKTGCCIISNMLGDNSLICSMAAIMAECHTTSNILYFSEDPLSFLLVLLDEIQEWERPAAGRKLLEEALSESIGTFSPFIETNIKPELNNINVSMNITKGASIDLNFVLDYPDDIGIQDDTNFSFPIMLYLKYKNFQRLRIGKSEKLRDALKNHCGVEDLFEFGIHTTIKTNGALAYKWHRQCDALLFRALRSRNKVITNWLYDETKYKEKRGVVKFEISKDKYLPKVFYGDFKELFLEGHNDYLDTRYLSIDNYDAEYIYDPSENPAEVKITAKVKRKIMNSRKEVPINGFYSSIDDEIKDLKLISVKENNNEVKVEKYEIRREKREDKTIFDESFAFYTQFETPLYYTIPESSKTLEYEMTYISPKEKTIYYDCVYNGFRNMVNDGKITVKWEKHLFDSLFQGGIKFQGSDKESDKLSNGVNNNENVTVNFLAYKGYDLKSSDVDSTYYKFVKPIKNLASLELSGFIWIKKNLDMSKIV